MTTENRLSLDTADAVFFYEQDHYYLSNFSSFAVEWGEHVFPTSEHLYHWLRFILHGAPAAQAIAERVRTARSAHEAFKLAQENKWLQVPRWDEQKEDLMRRILWAKVEQHDYARRKLLETGDRVLVENSWRDSFWGWGPNRDGQNRLGQLWMHVRSELRCGMPTPRERFTAMVAAATGSA